MRRKKGIPNFNMSEPEFLISILDRHKDWAIIICLIGVGQEINKGESLGIYGWIEAIKNKYKDWDIYVPNEMEGSEYLKDINIKQQINKKEELHLSVPLRSFRNENLSKFVNSILDIKKEEAKSLYINMKNYPIFITRDLDKAKKWVKFKSKGSERYGIIASSGAKRLRKYGVWVQSKIDAQTWFLNDKDDVRSSYSLEETATEFDVQGLELDWTIVCWDVNLRISGDEFSYYDFRGDKWNIIRKKENITYLQNAYRVLLTRARQGFVIFIPKGDDSDITAKPEFYDGIYNYLKDIGIQDLQDEKC